MTSVYQIDGEDLFPQPDSHKWDDGILGYDGDGAPFRRKYRTVTLSSQHLMARHMWGQYDDGASHSVRMPEPGKSGTREGDWTTYTTVYITIMESAVRGASAREGLEMRINKVAA